MNESDFRKLGREKYETKISIRIPKRLLKEVRHYKLNVSEITRNRLMQITQYLNKQELKK